jgi:hypothetical protein
MTPTTRAQLGLVPLPEDQARRIEQQGRELANGRYMRWPEGIDLLEPAPLTELPDVADSDWGAWDSAVAWWDGKR